MKPEQLTALILKWTGDGHQQLSLLPASQLKEAHCPSFPTSAGALLHGLVPELGRGVKEALLAIYPASHPMELAHLQADGSLLLILRRGAAVSAGLRAAPGPRRPAD